MLLLAALLGSLSPTASAKDLSLKMNNVQVQCTACPVCGPILIPGRQHSNIDDPRFEENNKAVHNQAYFSSTGEFDAVTWERDGQRAENPANVDRASGSFVLTIIGVLGNGEYQYKLEKLTQNRNRMWATNRRDRTYCGNQKSESARCRFADKSDIIAKGKIDNSPTQIKVGDKTYTCKVIPRVGDPAPASGTSGQPPPSGPGATAE